MGRGHPPDRGAAPDLGAVAPAPSGRASWVRPPAAEQSLEGTLQPTVCHLHKGRGRTQRDQPRQLVQPVDERLAGQAACPRQHDPRDQRHIRMCSLNTGEPRCTEAAARVLPPRRVLSSGEREGQPLLAPARTPRRGRRPAQARRPIPQGICATIVPASPRRKARPALPPGLATGDGQQRARWKPMLNRKGSGCGRVQQGLRQRQP